MDELLQGAPGWLLRPLGAFAEIDEARNQRIRELGDRLPDSIEELGKTLAKTQSLASYDSAANIANALVWQNIDALFARDDLAIAVCVYCEQHLTQHALSRVLRRMIVHPHLSRFGKRLIKDTQLHEVSLPSRNWEGATSINWSGTRLGKRRTGSRRRRDDQGVPDIETISELRELLKIRSPKQLGFLLSAVAEEGGAYSAFEIAKRHGGEARQISAPCSTLLWVQRRIYRRILANVAPHPAAHGFIQGRSTATNAAPHVGAHLLLKFDLRDFFPTIHESRVTGLFGSLGYHVGNSRFTSDDRSRDVAPTLARLCCVAPRRKQRGVLPQGAPTSPAISNLICRRLDQRLTGLAEKFGGCYTRYADDLTFSFSKNIAVGKFRWWVDQVCFREGFTVRQDKFRAIRSSQCQQVTGIVVNERMNVTRRDRRRFRAILHQCRRDGIEAREREIPGLGSYMLGFAAYVNMVDPTDRGQLLREVAEILEQHQ